MKKTPFNLMTAFKVKIGIGLFIIVLNLCVYSQVQTHEFINFDDNLYINNKNVQAGLTLEGLIWAFTTSEHFYWHPLTWVSHMLDYQLYGSNPMGHHLTNLFLHIVSALLVFIVFLSMTGGVLQSGFVAAIFALHPINVESIAWIAERKNVLSTLFWFLTIWAYLGYVKKSTVKRYGLVFLFFALGLMSKPMMVTLPFVLILLDQWPLRRLKVDQEKRNNETSEIKNIRSTNVLKLIIEKIPLIFLSALISIATVHSQKIAGSVKSLDLFSLQTRLANATVSYLEYLGKLLWPSGLSILYPHPGNGLPVWQGIICGLVLVFATIISIKLFSKVPYFTIGWFWYLGTLVPVIGMVQVGVQSMADRFAYIPQVGIFIIFAWGVPDLISKWRHKTQVLSISTGIIIIALLATTWKQVSHWRNSTTIFQHAVEVIDKKNSNFALVYNNLGMALINEKRIKEAIPNLMKAIKVSPNHTYAHYNLGIAFNAERKNEEAVFHYKQAIKLNPYYVNAHYNLGNTLFAMKKTEEAISHYKSAVGFNPDYTNAHYNLGNALLVMKKTEEAISHYKSAVKLNPDFTHAHYNLGIIYLQKKEAKEAIYHLREVLRLRPDFNKAGDYLETALVQSAKPK